MKKVSILALCLAAAPLAAQPATAPKYLLIHEEVVKPGEVAKYESINKSLIAMVATSRDVAPTLHFSAGMSRDFHYVYAEPVASLDAVAKTFDEISAVVGKNGKTAADLMRTSATVEEHEANYVLALRPDLSYIPAGTHPRPEEMGFYHVDIYFIQPGMDGEAEKVSADFLALFKKKNMPDPYYIAEAFLGPETPAIVVRTDAKDEASYLAAEAGMRATLGDEGKALFARAFAITRRFESHDFWRRPDLSVPAPVKN